MTIALVLYESRTDLDRRIVEAVADGLATRLPAEALPLVRAPRQLSTDTCLLVVGRPCGTTGLHEWLTELSTTVPGIPAASWVTRDHPRPGVHAHGEERLLHLRGFDLVAPTEHFVLGPLDDEVRRAREWGVRLGEMVGRRAKVPAIT